MNTITLPTSLNEPLLHQGQRLDREEFERLYEQMPGVKAELLDGVVYMASPVSESHGSPHGDLMTWIGTYKAFTPGTISGDNTTMRMPTGSNPQPDVYLRINDSCGGQSRLDEDEYVIGSAELIGEIAYSSVHVDRTIKRSLYQRNGIREFILWRIEDRAIDWFALRDSTYELLPSGEDGIIRSEVFPGLWLDLECMIRGDMGSVLRVLQKGLDSAEHERFVRQLAVR